MSIFVTITLHALTDYALLFTIAIVIYLVLSLYLALTNARVAQTITYILIYFAYVLRNKVSYYPISSTRSARDIMDIVHRTGVVMTLHPCLAAPQQLALQPTKM